MVRVATITTSITFFLHSICAVFVLYYILFPMLNVLLVYISTFINFFIIMFPVLSWEILSLFVPSH